MIAYLALAFVVALATAQEEAPCECGVFVNIEGKEVHIVDLPPTFVHFCDQHEPCHNHCVEEFEIFTHGGDLGAETPEGPVGQVLCTLLEAPVEDEFVSAFSNLCNTTWEYAGVTTLQPLCCDASFDYYECHGFTTVEPVALH